MRTTVYLGLGLGAALLLGGLASCGGGSGRNPGSGPSGPDAWEVNDDIGSCASITLNFIDRNLTIHDGADEDYFCFTLTDDSLIQVLALFPRAAGEIEVQVLDGSGAVLLDSLPQTDAEMISDVLLGGSYVIRVFSPTLEKNAYTLDVEVTTIVLDPPPDPKESLGDDVFCGPDIGDILAAPYVDPNATLHHFTDVDYSCFTLSASADVDVEITFSHIEGNLDLQLLDSNQKVLQSSWSQWDDESVSALLAPGTYSIRVFSPSGDTNRYTLMASGAARPPFLIDRLEPNDLPTLCHPLLPFSGGSEPLTIHDPTDEDWFCLTLAPRGGGDWGVNIDLFFQHAIGDLDMDLLDDQLVLIQSAQSMDDDEHIDLRLLEGDYFVRVYSPGDTNRYFISAWIQ